MKAMKQLYSIYEYNELITRYKKKGQKKRDFKFQILVSSSNLKCNTTFKVNGVFIIGHGEKSFSHLTCIYPNKLLARHKGQKTSCSSNTTLSQSLCS
jgi:hypothetical protein